MGGSERTQLERYHLAYQRGAVVCLLGSVAVAGYFLAVIFGGVSGHLAGNAALVLVALFFFSLLAVHLVTLRGRRWRRSDPEAQLVLRDEWTRRNRHRASWIAFGVVMWAQVPLALLMSRLASEPSFSGMAGLSMTLGAGAFFATYLYLGRQQGDG